MQPVVFAWSHNLSALHTTQNPSLSRETGTVESSLVPQLWLDFCYLEFKSIMYHHSLPFIHSDSKMFLELALVLAIVYTRFRTYERETNTTLTYFTFFLSNLCITPPVDLLSLLLYFVNNNKKNENKLCLLVIEIHPSWQLVPHYLYILFCCLFSIKS